MQINNSVPSTEARSSSCKKRVILIAAVIAVLMVGFLLFMKVIAPAQKYNSAVSLMENGSYEEAIAVFTDMEGYKDSTDMIKQCKEGIRETRYNAAVALLNDGKFADALTIFESLGDYKDSYEKIYECNTGILDAEYDAAVALMDSGKYEEAIEAFSALEYKDSRDKIAQCNTAIAEARYNDAIALMSAGKYINAFELLNGVDYMDSAEKLEECRSHARYELTNVGDIITFGKYEQDNDLTNGPEPIKWRVLDKKDGKALIISEKAIEKMPFFAIYWKRSTISAFFESSFLYDFTPEEKAMFVTTTVTADKHPDFPDTDQGADTQNKLFILSVDEANKYFRDDEDRICYATEYIIADNMDVEDDGRCDWWLRTACKNWSNGAIIANVDPTGMINASTHNCRMGLRPCAWIQLEPVE